MGVHPSFDVTRMRHIGKIGEYISCTAQENDFWIDSNGNKLAPYGTDGRLLLTANGPDKLYVLCPNLRIRGHLPAPIWDPLY